MPNLALPHSEGEIVLESSDPNAHPAIRMNYYDDPHDMKVMIAAIRRSLDIAGPLARQPQDRPRFDPAFLAEKHR